MKLLYFTLLFCVLASLVNAIQDPSFQIQDADSAFYDVKKQIKITDSRTHCSFNHLHHFTAIKSVRLLSSDNEEFIISKEIAEQSVVIRNLLEDVSETDPVIPLANITAKTVQKVIEWCEHHISDPVITDETERRTIEIDEWDQTFLQVDQETLFDIILAAWYLDIKGLVDAGSKTVANMIMGRTAKEIQTIFNIENEFTPEEEAQIIKENGWTEDPSSAARNP